MDLNIKEKDVKLYAKERFKKYYSEISDKKFNELWQKYKDLPDFKINENIFIDAGVKDYDDQLHLILRLVAGFYRSKIDEMAIDNKKFNEFIGHYKNDKRWQKLKFIKEINRTPIVYIITCGHMMYIGAHILPTVNEEEFIDYLKKYNSSSYYKDYFDEEKCKYEILKTFDSYQDAVNFESFLHHYLDVDKNPFYFNKYKQKIFYNSTSFNSKPALLINENLEILAKYPSIAATKKDHCALYNSLYKKSIPINYNNQKCKIVLEEDYLMLDKENYNMSEYWYDTSKDAPRNKSCVAVDVGTYEVEFFDSIAEARKKYNNGSISAAIKREEVYVCENKVWFDKEEYDYYLEKNLIEKIVDAYNYMRYYVYQKYYRLIQKDLDNNIIEEFESINVAAEKLGVEKRFLHGALTSGQKTYKGFKWERIKKNVNGDKIFNEKRLIIEFEQFIRKGYVHDHGSLEGFWEARRIYDNAPVFGADENIYEYYSEWNDKAHSIMKYTTGFYLKLAMESMLIDTNDPNVMMDLENGNIGTFNRLAKVFVGFDTHDDSELGSGRWMKPIRLAKFPNTSKKRVPIIKEVSLVSACSHHFISFNSLSDPESKVIVAYIPDKFVLGISKLSRLVNFLSRRFYLQEDLTKKLYEEISKAAETEDVYVGLFNLVHGCEKFRGKCDPNGKFTTEYYGGEFESSPELLERVRNS